MFPIIKYFCLIFNENRRPIIPKKKVRITYGLAIPKNILGIHKNILSNIHIRDIEQNVLNIKPPTFFYANGLQGANLK